MAVQSLENLHTFLLWQQGCSYNIIEDSATSLAHNSVFIGPNNSEFGTDAYMHVVWSGRPYQNLGQIDHNLHNHFLMMSYANHRYQ